ncbi:MAG: ribokinase [Cyanobacteria bacterium J06598_1]
MDVVVLGSLNMDLVAQVSRLPQPGETLAGESFAMVPGGKGANQAVAAARLGAQTAMIGQVGNDGMGQILRSHLQNEDIEIAGITLNPHKPSGTALIAVSPENNHIIVNAGANGAVDEGDLEALMPYFKKARVLLLQFEVPLPIVEKAAALAYTAGMTVIVDPAPAKGPLPLDFCDYISILTPNQTEAAILTGQPVDDIKGAIVAAETLQQKGIDAVIVKMGAMGCVCATARGSFAVPVYRVDAIDTVAAGDAFNGGLAAALCQQNYQRGEPLWPELLRESINYASAVAAIAVTRPGAQSSMPVSAEVEEFMRYQRV